MKVLMFGWEFPPQITGGLGTACYGITKSLAKQNVNVLFVVPKAFGNEDRRFATLQDAGEIPSRYLESNSRVFWRNVLYKEMSARLVPYTTPEDFKKKPENDILRLLPGKDYEISGFTPFSGRYGIDLWNEIERYSMVTSLLAARENYDIIHAHEWLTFPAAISAKKISGKPLIVHIHATEFDRNSGIINRDIYDIEKKGMELSDKIIAVSNYTKDIVTNRYGIHSDKVVTIHNGIDKIAGPAVSKSEKLSDEKIVTFLGRITFQKGPEYFIEAAYKVLQKQSNVRFVMAGSGDLKDKILRQVDNLGISAKVSFPGFLKSDEVKKLFSQTDVFVMPSVSEPFGITPLEALRSEVPVIISKQSGVSEVIKHTIKVDYWDINALSDAIYGVLNYKTLSDLLSSKGSNEVNKLRWGKTGKQILDVYKSLV
jgi:glycosyltransferase involved in cell wall biosynthesis